MSNAGVVKMPKRFDYGASSEFNMAFGLALNQVNGDNKMITLDCMHMEYIDSAGIGLLVMSHKKAQNVNSKISVINIKPPAKDIFLLANIQKLIEIK